MEGGVRVGGKRSGSETGRRMPQYKQANKATLAENPLKAYNLGLEKQAVKEAERAEKEVPDLKERSKSHQQQPTLLPAQIYLRMRKVHLVTALVRLNLNAKWHV